MQEGAGQGACDRVTRGLEGPKGCFPASPHRDGSSVTEGRCDCGGEGSPLALSGGGVGWGQAREQSGVQGGSRLGLGYGVTQESSGTPEPFSMQCGEAARGGRRAAQLPCLWQPC